MSRFTVRTPSTSKPSSVRVPVLSKHTTSNFPPTFTLKQVLAEEAEDKRGMVVSLLRTDAKNFMLFQS